MLKKYSVTVFLLSQSLSFFVFWVVYHSPTYLGNVLCHLTIMLVSFFWIWRFTNVQSVRDLGVMVLPQEMWWLFMLWAGSLWYLLWPPLQALEGLLDERLSVLELPVHAEIAAMHSASGNAHHWHVAYIIFSVLIYPAAEEIVYRGVFFRSLHFRVRSILLAAVVSALVASLFHAYPLVWFIYGIILAWVYVLTKSLLPGIFMNASFQAWILLVVHEREFASSILRSPGFNYFISLYLIVMGVLTITFGRKVHFRLLHSIPTNGKCPTRAKN